jgi:isopenicillin-N epimerase
MMPCRCHATAPLRHRATIPLVPSALAKAWTLDPAITFLNHGSFGATPRAVLDAQTQWRVQMEADPVRFLAQELEAHLDGARAELATFLGADHEDLAFMPNATAGINTVLSSLRFAPGDELLVTDHAYNAAKNALEGAAERWGARSVVVDLPFPGATPGDVCARILRAVSPRTRFALIDHVTSPTALAYPVRDLIAELAARGVETLIDGAHAPGMLELNLRALGALGADYYAGNCHKWLCAPKGSGFLWVRRERQAQIRPLAISHGANSPRTDRSRFRIEMDWTGTMDPSAYLAVADALRFGGSLLPGGWAELRARNHALAVDARDILCAALEVEPPAPDEMIGSMASVQLPFEAGPGAVQGVDLADPLHDRLLDEHGIQVMITPWPQRPAGLDWRRLVRISAAPYNSLDDYRLLAKALPEAIAGLAT